MHIKKRDRLNLIIPNSKGQVAVFLILALAILIAGIIYFYYQRQSVEKQIEVVDPQVAPIKLYVESCIKSVAEDGLEKIGLSGGYITIPEQIKNDPMAYLSAFPVGGFKVPYWWHDGIDAVPTEEFIKRQLEGHIKSELRNCISNFEPFSGSFEINELKEALVDVEFNENDVSVSLNYPLEIISKNGDLKVLLERYSYSVPVRFKRVYELAKLIIERENKDYFIEKKTIDLYSMDSEIPTTEVEAACNSKVWLLSNIKEKLKTLLRVNLPYIRIKGTEYNPNLYVPNTNGKNTYADSYFQQHYIWEIDAQGEKKFKNMKVAFAYDNWPLDIYARPSENGVLRSNAQKGTGILSFLCLHVSHFTYDVSFPVMATIFDLTTASNHAYRFSFPFKVSIDHNQPNTANKGTALLESAQDLTSEDFCNFVQNEVTIFTVDNATGEDIRDVNLTFVCGRFYCDAGHSNWLSLGAAAGITRRFPFCVNGIIKGSKQGYTDTNMFIQTDVDGRSYVLTLNPVKELQNYKVVKHLLSNPGIAQELAPNEKASITIKGKNTGFESYAAYPKESNFPLRLPKSKDEIYEITIYIADEENIIGGYTGEWKVNKDDLGNAEEAVFHAIVQGSSTDEDRALLIYGLSSHSKNVPSPELK
ncbi:MAG: hypothetical protein AABX33_05380 [Nanoarchaeota archaeon]